MEISIKSDTDSRILLYPLIKALYPYGTVAVYTSNKYLSRLIDNDLEGGFRNIRIIVNTESDVDAMKYDDEWDPQKYTFTIYDNVGAVDYDVLFAILTNHISDSYMMDLLYIIQDPKTNIIRFGTPAAKPKDPSKDKKKNKKSADEEVEEVEEQSSLYAVETVDDDHFNKWHQTKSDANALQEALKNESQTWCKYPSFEIIEKTESRQILPVPDDKLLKEIYTVLKDSLAIDERTFMKGAKITDEGSSTLGGSDVW